MTNRPSTEIRFPPAFQFLFQPAPYKVAYGGRGSGKSQSYAQALLIESLQRPMRVLCTREFQASISDSVKRLMQEIIETHGLSPLFDVQRDVITARPTGSEFLFKGIKVNPNAIRSIHGIDRCWVEEAQVVSAESWMVLLPSLFRKPGCELWITFNPDQERDPTYDSFVTNPPPGSLVRKVNWQENPWFPPGLDAMRRHMLTVDPDAYDWVWEGNCRKIGQAVIFKNRVFFEPFETPADARFYLGADWGFAADPSVVVRCFIRGRDLYIDHEAFGYGIEIDRLGAEVFDRVPGAGKIGKRWPITADNARPETISFMQRHGYPVQATEKWSGSIEDGIEFLKSFERIVVHPRCPNISQEFRLYSYKTDPKQIDPKTKQPAILPVVLDKHNHGIDALRYALDGEIRAARMPKISPEILKKAAQPVWRR